MKTNPQDRVTPTRSAILRTATATAIGLATIGAIAPASAAGPPGSSPAASTTKVVTTTADSGTGSLRAAIFKANNPSLNVDRIEFDIPGGGTQVIAPLTDLPALTAPVTIDGYTQPGAREATADRPARLRVVVDATRASWGIELETDDSTVRGLVVQNAHGDGLRANGDNDTFAGNYVGLKAGGAQGAGNRGNGIFVHGSDNTVGGLTPGDRNVISANTDSGVFVQGDGNAVAQNTIGTTADGTAALGNGGYGVWIRGSFDKVLGGTPDGTYSLVSANALDGVYVEFGDQDLVFHNLIGTDVTGATDLGNGGDGVRTLGSDTLVSEDVVSGNGGHGVEVKGDEAKLLLDRIGISDESAGDVAIPNDGDGIRLTGNDALVGDADEGNTVVANGGDGIRLAGERATVAANLVGTDASGDPLLGNAGDGIAVAATQSTIGGADPTLANVVADSGAVGIHVRADDDVVQGNLVGTDSTGLVDLGNIGDGVRIEGDRVKVTGNTVLHNDAAGIMIRSGTDDPVTSNGTADNDGIGIDLFPPGPTANDVGDGDAGANDVLNFPIVGRQSFAGADTRVTWGIQAGLPLTMMRLELFVSDSCDAPDREGATPLGTDVVTTDVNGNAMRKSTIPVATTPGEGVTATATLLPNPLSPTSEYSVCRTLR